MILHLSWCQWHLIFAENDVLQSFDVNVLLFHSFVRYLFVKLLNELLKSSLWMRNELNIVVKRFLYFFFLIHIFLWNGLFIAILVGMWLIEWIIGYFIIFYPMLEKVVSKSTSNSNSSVSFMCWYTIEFFEIEMEIERNMNAEKSQSLTFD